MSLENLQRLAYLRQVIAKQRCIAAEIKLNESKQEFEATRDDLEQRDHENRSSARARFDSCINRQTRLVEFKLANLAHEIAENKADEHAEIIEECAELVEETEELLQETQRQFGEKYRKYEKLRILAEHPRFAELEED